MLTRSQACERSEDVGRNPTDNPTIGDVIAARFDRRDILKGALGVAAIAATVSPLALRRERANAQARVALPLRRDRGRQSTRTTTSPTGYDADVLIRWGDPVLPGAPAFDPARADRRRAAQQFGYNNDFLGYFPMPGAANPVAARPARGQPRIHQRGADVPGLGRQDVQGRDVRRDDAELVDIEMAAHGGAVIEVQRENGKWQVVAGSKYARRIDADTPMEITGPAAGHARMQTTADPSRPPRARHDQQLRRRRDAVGHVAHLRGEFPRLFLRASCRRQPSRGAQSRRATACRRDWYAWGKFHDRFDVGKEPNEPNRFGWIVEIDPFDPASTPKKRTALGRAKHEGAAGIINKDGRYVIYIRRRRALRLCLSLRHRRRASIAPTRSANRDILDDGVLSVARYNADGTLDWLPLVHGQGPLTAANGFASQADVLIETRRAGRSARRHQDGPAGGRRGQSGDAARSMSS